MNFNWLELCYDVSQSGQLGFQDPASPIMEEIIHLHDKILFYLILVVTVVLWMVIRILSSNSFKNFIIPHRYFTHGTTIEIVWTIIPAIILLTIAFPSFKLLYLMDEVIEPTVTIKTIGHQWYWSYEYSDYVNNDKSLQFDSYMINEDDLTPGQYRLLEVDNRIMLPTNTHVRVIVSAADVLHCWAVPSLGVKVDAVPGRLNQTSFLIKREGVYYGQCSEICGFGHAFMPIVIQAVSPNAYIDWVISQ